MPITSMWQWSGFCAMFGGLTLAIGASDMWLSKKRTYGGRFPPGTTERVSRINRISGLAYLGVGAVLLLMALVLFVLGAAVGHEALFRPLLKPN
jgi:hypothetical protein